MNSLISLVQKELRNVWRSWQGDLEAARDLDKGQRERVGFVVKWFLGWLEKAGELPGRDSVRGFWKGVVKAKERESW